MNSENEKMVSLDDNDSNTQAKNSNTIDNKPIEPQSQVSWEKKVYFLCKDIVDNFEITKSIPILEITSEITKSLEGELNMVTKENVARYIKQYNDALSSFNEIKKELEGTEKLSQNKEVQEVMKLLEKDTKDNLKALLEKVIERLDEIKTKLNEQQRQNKRLVKGSLSLDENLIGLNPIQLKEKIESITEEQKKQAKESLAKRQAQEKNIEMGNPDLSLSEKFALFALQKSMSDRNYKSEVCFRGDAESPIYSITTAEYLENFGVGKRLTKRGYQEFLSNERKEALDALRKIASRRVFLLWKVPILNSSNFDAYGVYEPIFWIVDKYENFSESELEKLLISSEEARAGKVDRIIFIPHRITFQNIGNYFWLKDSNYLKEIKELTKKKNSKYICTFIDQLIDQTAKKIRAKQVLVFERTTEQLAYDLHMEKDIKERRWKRIKKYIEFATNIALKLNHISSFKIGKAQNGKEKYTFTLSAERFQSKNTLSDKQE